MKYEDTDAFPGVHPALTRPQLEQVVQDLDVLLEVQCAGQLLRVDEDPVGVARRVLPLAEQHRAEAHRQVLARHLVHVLARRHQLQVVEERLQGHLRRTEGYRQKSRVMIRGCDGSTGRGRATLRNPLHRGTCGTVCISASDTHEGKGKNCPEEI